MRRLLVVVALTVVTACSSVETPPAASSSGSPSSSGGAVNPTPTTDSGVINDGGSTLCTTLAESGVLVDVVAIAGDPPAAMGGTLIDGNYVLTTDEVYVGASGTPGTLGTSVRSTIRISNSGSAMERVLDSVDANNKTTSTVEVLALTATATNLLLSTTCPANGQTASTQYSADGSNLSITDPVSKERRSYLLK